MIYSIQVALYTQLHSLDFIEEGFKVRKRSIFSSCSLLSVLENIYRPVLSIAFFCYYAHYRYRVYKCFIFCNQHQERNIIVLIHYNLSVFFLYFLLDYYCNFIIYVFFCFFITNRVTVSLKLWYCIRVI